MCKVETCLFFYLESPKQKSVVYLWACIIEIDIHEVLTFSHLANLVTSAAGSGGSFY